MKKGQLKAMIARGTARIDRNNNNMVRVIRARLGLSQSEFAEAYHLSLRTVQEWEQGRYEPDQIARNYLSVIGKKPQLVRRLLKETVSSS